MTRGARRQARPTRAAIAALATRAWRAGYAGLLAPDVLNSLDPVEQNSESHAYLTDLPPAGRCG